MIFMTFWNQLSILMTMQPTYQGQWMQKMVDYLVWKATIVMCYYKEFFQLGCEGLQIKTLVLYCWVGQLLPRLILKDPKAKWIRETRRTYSSYTMQAWEVLASSILWCYGPPCCSLASRSNSKRPGTISVDISNWKVIRSFDAFINCIFPTWYKITFCVYFFLVGTLKN